MRDYGRVYSSFWQSPETRTFTEDGRTLALYLLTSPHANLIGCYRLPDAYAAEDLLWSSERVREGFADLTSKGFVSRDESTKWVLIHKYLKWNGFENGNVATAAHKAFDQVPSIPLKALLAAALLEFGCHLKEPFANHLQTVVESFANPEPEPILSLNPIQNLSPSTALFAPPPAEDVPAKVRPAKAAKEVAPSAETWAAYSTAYAHRYNAEPVRNATVNGQLAQLVGRLGADEAPAVAAWYVGHNNRFYVGAGHSVGVLLKDCEKLRTEWVTGRQATAAQAIQTDRTQTNLNAFAGMIAEAQAQERTHAEH
jgi:hypothetical protein